MAVALLEAALPYSVLFWISLCRLKPEDPSSLLPVGVCISVLIEAKTQKFVWVQSRDPGTSWFVVSRSWRAAGSWALAGIFQATLNACKKAADQANNWHFWVLAVGIVQLSAVVQNSPKQNIRPVRSKQVCRNLPPLHGSWSSAPESHLNPLEDCLFFFPSLFLTLLCLFCF